MRGRADLPVSQGFRRKRRPKNLASYLHPEGMIINQPGVARQRYPGVNADSILTLKGLYPLGSA